MASRVLIAQYQLEVAAMLSFILDQYDCETLIASRGSEAQKLLLNPEEKIDLVISELLMPDIGGAELAIALKEGKYIGRDQGMPVILLNTIGISQDDPENILEATGAQAYIQPPISIDRFIELVENSIGPLEKKSGTETIPIHLDGIGVARFLFAGYLFGVTGRVVLRSGSIAKEIEFDQGRILRASSSLFSDRLGNLLLADGKISEAQLNETLIEIASSGKKLGDVLVAKGFINADLLTQYLQLEHENIVKSCLGMRSAEVNIDFSESSKEIGVQIKKHLFKLIYDGLAENFSENELRKNLVDPNEYLIPNFDSSIRPTELGLELEELEALIHINGIKTMEDFMDSSEMTSSQAGALLLALLITRLIWSSRYKSSKIRSFLDQPEADMIYPVSLGSKLYERGIAIEKGEINSAQKLRLGSPDKFRFRSTISTAGQNVIESSSAIGSRKADLGVWLLAGLIVIALIILLFLIFTHRGAQNPPLEDMVDYARVFETIHIDISNIVTLQEPIKFKAAGIYPI